MNPDLNWWARLGAILAVETALIVAVAKCLALRWGSTTERHFIWRAAVIGLIGVCCGELVGIRPDRWIRSESLNPRELQWTVQKENAPAAASAAINLPQPSLNTHTPASGPAWWPGWVWLTGTLLLLARTLAARLRLGWKCRATASTAAPDAETQTHIEELRAQLGLGPIRVRVWPGLQGPIVFGVVRPTLVIPPEFQTRFSTEQRRAVLSHELSHLAAFDPAWLAVAQATTAVLWWQPLAWWTARELRRASEAAADQASILIPGGRIALAESLVLLGRAWTSRLERERLGAAGSGPRSELSRRVHALLEPVAPSRSRAGTRRILLVACGLSVAALLLVPLPGLTQPGLASLLAAKQPAPDGVAETHTPQSASVPAPSVTPRESLPPAAAPASAPLPFSGFQKPSLTLEPPPGTSPQIVYVPLRPNIPSEPPPPPRTSAPDPIPTAQPRPRSETASDTEFATRTWRVDSRLLFERLNLAPPVPDDAATARTAIRQLLANAGVEIPSASPASTSEDPARKAFLFRPGPGPGTLFARATPGELDRIEHEIYRMNRLDDQVHLRVHVIELNAGGADDSGLDALFGQSTTNNPVPEVTPPSGRMPGTGTPFAERIQVEKLSIQGQAATLSEEQFSALRQRLEARGGTDWLTAPDIVTTSGRRAQVAVQDVRTIVTGPRIIPETATNSGAILYEAIQVGIGPVVELASEFTGQGWKLSASAQVDDFMGYADPDVIHRRELMTSTGALRALDALPRFRTREVVGSGHLTTGQTLALRGPEVTQTIQFKDKVPVLGDIPLLGRLFRSEGKQSIPKRLYVFVTVMPANPGESTTPR